MFVEKALNIVADREACSGYAKAGQNSGHCQCFYCIC
jgi:hypothetical protein